MNYGGQFPRSNIFWEVGFTIATQIAGISYLANRIAAAWMYFLILLVSLILSVVDFRHRKINWYVIPLSKTAGIMILFFRYDFRILGSGFTDGMLFIAYQVTAMFQCVP